MSDKTFTVIMPDIVEKAGVELDVFADQFELLTPFVESADAIEDSVWSSVDAVMAWHELQYSAEVIDKLANCKMMIRIGVGFDNIDIQYAGSKGIQVCNVPDYGTTEVADHAIALMLSLWRALPACNAHVADGTWHWHSGGDIKRLGDAHIGIIGLGSIGTATAMRAKAFGSTVSFYDPYLADGVDKALGIQRCYQLDELLQQSDILSIHTPLTEETRNLANDDFFAQVKKGVQIINTGRGEVIDTAALHRAMQRGDVAKAGLDVLPQEPADTSDPLIAAWLANEDNLRERVIITPHNAFYSEEAFTEMRRKGAEEVKRVLLGEAARNCVNREFLV
ncbi:MAG: C-terminal binding protein [Planctomycetes bacterium]|nr:C-terminal binding protein [Planctomycetota bacterium]